MDGIGAYTHRSWVVLSFRRRGVEEAVLLHNPVSLYPLGRLSLVEDEGFFHADALNAAGGHYRLVGAGRFPVPRRRCPVRSHAVRVFPIPRAEEEPFPLPEQRLICIPKQQIQHIRRRKETSDKKPWF